jgi:hypothetical protein
MVTGPPLGVLMMLVLGGAGAVAHQSVQTFDAAQAGQPPEGFTFAAMRQAAPGTFVVRHAGASGYLVHAATAGAKGFSIAIANGEPLSDLVISVRLRLSGGARAGGVVWRYVDPQNFYAAVLDLDRGELSLFRVTGGNMIKIEEEEDLELDRDAWHMLKVVHEDAQVRVSLGGIRVFTDDERRHNRLLPQGRAGLLAAGNADVAFDDLRIAPDRGRR